MEKSTIKKSVAGLVGTGLLAVGSFLWDNGGKQATADVTKKAIQENAPELIASLPEPFKTHLLNGEISAENSKEFQAAYERCYNKAGQNPNLDLKDTVAVFDYSIKCLLVEENQGATLDKMAEKDEELKLTLKEIRTKISQQP